MLQETDTCSKQAPMESVQQGGPLRMEACLHLVSLLLFPRERPYSSLYFFTSHTGETRLRE